MKHSIKKIFWHLKSYLSFVLFMALLSVMVLMEHQLSIDKVDNLQNQKKIINSLLSLSQKDKELALIQFNGKSVQLLQKIDELKTIYKYNFTDKYLLDNAQDYLHDLQALSSLTREFNKVANAYYNGKTDKKNLDRMFTKLTQHINNIIFKNIEYSKEKFTIMKYAAYFVLLLIVIATFWYRKMINNIYEDIRYLYQVDKKQNYNIFSIEADAIALRMNRKSVVNDNNPNNIDQVTGINNYRGMLNSYANKKALKSSNFTSVTVFEIDNFSKTNRVFPQEIAQTILKKIAYTISLHEQPVDVIARTDYNQFTVILSRPSKEQTFKDANLIRESISELKFNLADKGNVKITLSGGHIIKPNNTILEEAIKQAKEILAYAKTTGKNHILQMRDIAQKDMQL